MTRAVDEFGYPESEDEPVPDTVRSERDPSPAFLEAMAETFGAFSEQAIKAYVRDRDRAARTAATMLAKKAYLWTDEGNKLKLRIERVEDLPPLHTLVTVMGRMKRWGGHAAEAISVARHSIMVAKIALEQNTVANLPERQKLVRSCLLHDASEVLYGDRSTPLKRLEDSMLPEGWRHPNHELVADFDYFLSLQYNLDLDDERLSQADKLACVVEARARGIPELSLIEHYGPELTEASIGIEMPCDRTNVESDWWRMWLVEGHGEGAP